MLLFHTDNLGHHGLETTFRLAKEAGFDGIEVGINHNFDTQNVEYLKSLEERYQIPIKAFSMATKGEEKLLKPFQETVKQFRNVTINIHAPDNLSFKYKKWVKEIAPKLAKKYNLTLCRRNVPFEAVLGIFPKRSENTLESLRAQGYVCADLTALGRSNVRIMESIKVLGTHLKHVYLSDVYKGQPYAFPGVGILELRDYLSKLAQIDYRGNFTLYVRGLHLKEGDDKKTLEKMIEAREFYEKYFIQELESGLE